MFEKVNPAHPDKIADRIAGAIVDIAYTKDENPHIAVEVLLGHGKCNVLIETDTEITRKEVRKVVNRLAGDNIISAKIVPQDVRLNDNQQGDVRCGDNGIFKGMLATGEQVSLTSLAELLYGLFPFDGKYIVDKDKGRLIICHSCVDENMVLGVVDNVFDVEDYSEKTITINPLGYWTGGLDVDSGATNRKLGSDMGDAVTGGGLHGKDLSKADVSLNIFAHLMAQEKGHPVEFSCAIGDDMIGGVAYKDIVKVARKYIQDIGGFEKFAEWGLLRC